MKKPWLNVFKGIGLIFLLTSFWLIFFAAISPGESNVDYEPFNGASIILGIISYIVLMFILQYNKAVKLKQEIATSFHAIAIKEKHAVKLIGQLQEVTDKIVDHELKMAVKNTYSELVEEEKQSDHLTSDGNDAQHSQNKRKQTSTSGSSGYHENVSQVSDKVTKLVERIERDTAGTADQSLRDLIAEIKEAEALITNQHLYHNDIIAQYNQAIYALPFTFFRKSMGFQEEFYV